jgi:hypothetical protein
MPRKLALTFVLLLVVATSATAQNPRSFVSITGVDTNTCAVGFPCRSFTRAMSQTNTGGEIVALDSGGYGPFAINRAVHIVAAPGQHVAITVPPGGSGIVISTSAASPVVISGININVGSGGYGIIALSYDSLTIDRCVIDGGSNGILIGSPASTARYVISDTTVKNSTDVAYVLGGGRGMIVRSRAEHAVGDGFSIVSGVATATNCAAVDNGGAGFIGDGTNATASLTLHHCLSSHNSIGVLADGNQPFSGTVRVTASEVTENGTGFLRTGSASFGSLTNSIVAGNTPGGDVPGAIDTITPR